MVLKEEDTIFVTGIPKDVADTQLKNMFEEKLGMNSVRYLTFVKDKTTGENAGAAFVQFYLSINAERILREFENREFDCAPLTLKKYISKSTREEQKKTKEEILNKHVEPKTVAIYGLSKKVNLKDVAAWLRQKFEKCGKVVNITVPRDRGNIEKHKGMAFIDFFKGSSCHMAIKQYDRKTIDTHKLRVERQLPKDQYQAMRKIIEEKKPKEEEKEGKKKQDKKKNDKKKVEEEGEDDEEELSEEEEQDNEESEEEESAEEEEEEQNSDGESEEEEEPKKEKSKKKKRASDKEDSPDSKYKENTIFVQNIPTDTKEEDLRELFQKKYGPLEYALMVKDRKTKLPVGTGFIKFYRSDDYESLMTDLEINSRLDKLDELGDDFDEMEDEDFEKLGNPDINGKIKGIRIKENDLIMSRAINKEIAEKKKKDKNVTIDKRFLHLAGAGNLKLDAKAPKDYIEQVRKRFKEKKEMLDRDPNLHITPTRLCVHNLPRKYKALKRDLSALFIEGATVEERRMHHEFEMNERKERGEPLPENPNRLPPFNIEDVPVKEREKIISNIIILHDKEQKKREKRDNVGTAFVQFTREDYAMSALKFTANKKGVLKHDKNRRLIIEFAMTDKMKLHIFEKLKEKKLRDEENLKKKMDREGRQENNGFDRRQNFGEMNRGRGRGNAFRGSFNGNNNRGNDRNNSRGNDRFGSRGRGRGRGGSRGRGMNRDSMFNRKRGREGNNNLDIEFNIGNSKRMKE